MLRFQVVLTGKHYFVLGAYLGAFSFLVFFLRNFHDVQRAYAQSHGWEVITTSLAFVGLLLGCCFACGCVGWLVGRAQTYSEKRRRTRNESLIVRR